MLKSFFERDKTPFWPCNDVSFSEMDVNINNDVNDDAYILCG